MSQSCSQGVSQGCGLIWSLPGEGYASKLMRLLAAFRSLQNARLGPQFLALCSLPCGPIHVVTYNMATCFFKARKKVSPRKTDVTVLHNIIAYLLAIACWLEVSHRSHLPSREAASTMCEYQGVTLASVYHTPSVQKHFLYCLS